MTWLEENETVLDADTALGTDSETIQAQIARHKDFQRALGTKQPSLDAVTRMGRTLRDRGVRTDAQGFNDMLSTLKQKWNGLCGKSVDRSVD